MKQFLITNTAFNGEAMALYNADGLLIKFDVGQTDMNERLVTYFKQQIPARVEALENAFKKDTVIVESEVIISFEQFWKKYDYKFHKDRAEQLFKRLNKTNQVLAFFGLDKYHKYLRKNPTQIKMHPDTYLRCKGWENGY